MLLIQEQVFVKYEHVVSFVIHARGMIQEVHVMGRDTLRKVGPYDIKRNPVLASDRDFTGYVMRINSGVTPLGIIP
jgi:hypothetical protein